MPIAAPFYPFSTSDLHQLSALPFLSMPHLRTHYPPNSLVIHLIPCFLGQLAPSCISYHLVRPTTNFPCHLYFGRCICFVSLIVFISIAQSFNAHTLLPLLSSHVYLTRRSLPHLFGSNSHTMYPASLSCVSNITFLCPKGQSVCQLRCANHKGCLGKASQFSNEW